MPQGVLAFFKVDEKRASISPARLGPSQRCWPEVLRLTSQRASGRRGIGMLEIWGKLTFRSNLCYVATGEKNWLREEDRLGDFLHPEGGQDLWLDLTPRLT